MDCWHFKSDMRPSFSEINEKLSLVLDKYESKKSNLVSLSLNEAKHSFNESSSLIAPLILNNNYPLAMNQPLPLPPFSLTKPQTTNINSSNSQHKISKNLNDTKMDNSNKRGTSIRSESEDSQYFSGVDNSLVYADSSNFSSASSTSAYSNYSVPPPSMMLPSSIETPPSPPPIKSLSKLLNVASAAYKL